MANICKRYVITTRGKNYLVGDDIIMKLKNGTVLVGIIESITDTEQLGWNVGLRTGSGLAEIPADLIED